VVTSIFVSVRIARGVDLHGAVVACGADEFPACPALVDAKLA
jgi:hypothetical protein